MDDKKQEFLGIFTEHIKRSGADNLLKWLEDSDFFTAPASARAYLAETGGLVKHSLDVYKRLRGIYMGERLLASPDEFHGLSPAEEESITIVGLLHDICKVRTFYMEPRNQKTYDPDKVAAAFPGNRKKDGLGEFIWETVMGYSIEDKFPFGDGEKSVFIINTYMRLKPSEAISIRWHTGIRDGQYAAMDAFAKYPLAAMTYMADFQAVFLDECPSNN